MEDQSNVNERAYIMGKKDAVTTFSSIRNLNYEYDKDAKGKSKQ